MPNNRAEYYILRPVLLSVAVFPQMEKIFANFLKKKGKVVERCEKIGEKNNLAGTVEIREKLKK